MKLASILCISFLLSAELAHAVDVDEIYKFEPCFKFKTDAGRPPAISAEVANQISSPAQFPSWGTPLGPYIRAIERMNNSKSLSCDADGTDQKLPFHPLMRSAALVAQNTVQLIQEDLDRQEADLKMLSNCLTEKPTSDRCDKILDFLVNDLNHRMGMLRKLMALKDGALPGKMLEHDLPMSLFISKMVFPGQKEWKTSMAPLSESEQSSLSEFSRKLPPGKSTHSLYDQLLSTTPILLLLDETVTRAGLQHAVEVLLKNRPSPNQDTDFRQEIFLQTPYVARAISKLPDHQQADACLATKAIFLNLKVQYQVAPRSLAGLVLIASIPIGAASAGMAAFLGKFLSRSIWGASGLTAIQVATLSKRYWTGMSYCSSIYREKNPFPEADGLCRLDRTLQIQSDGESAVAINAALLGAMKIVPATVKIATGAK